MRRAAGRIPIAPGWVAHGIRESRADRKRYFHAFNSSACSGRDSRLFNLDLLCRDIGAFQRAIRTGEGCGHKEVRVIGRRRCGRLSFQYAGSGLPEPTAPGDAQKYFEQALEADPKFSVARLNLGVSLLAQQKLEPARAALEAAAQQLPKDAYAWYSLGLVYKDTGEPEKGLAAFQHVTEIAPNEADAYYFSGYLNSQLQKYDEAIAGFQKGLALNAFHASMEFGLARAF